MVFTLATPLHFSQPCTLVQCGNLLLPVYWRQEVKTMKIQNDFRKFFRIVGILALAVLAPLGRGLAAEK